VRPDLEDEVPDHDMEGGATAWGSISPVPAGPFPQPTPGPGPAILSLDDLQGPPVTLAPAVPPSTREEASWFGNAPHTQEGGGTRGGEVGALSHGQVILPPLSPIQLPPLPDEDAPPPPSPIAGGPTSQEPL
jgi:hypothetical protein